LLRRNDHVSEAFDAESRSQQKVEAVTLGHPTEVSLIVPTLRRPDYLFRCLSSLSLQTERPTEVLVGIRADDDLSRPIVREFSDPLQIRAVKAKGVGVVGAMNSCLTQAKGRLIGLVDDDLELPPNWLKKMIRHLDDHSDVLGAGGRESVQDHPAKRCSEPHTSDVGRLHWFGRITGNHYRGHGLPRKVDLLRGSNRLYRGDFLRSVGFYESLRGQGAQVHWELAPALLARWRRKHLFYDPEIQVLHHVAPRMDSDQIHRDRFSFDATVDLAFNETYIILKYGSGVFRMTGLLWQLLVGSRACPGIANLVRSAIKSKPFGFLKVRATFKGRCLAALAM
jgi:glycosyltransferase involved in cell wall biosynthesis